MTRSDARRARLFFWLRLVVSLALIAVLIRKTPSFSDLFPSAHHGRTLALFAVALLVTVGGIVLSAWRWQRVATLFDVEPSLARLTAHTLEGLFVGNVMPSTIGGDVLRVTRATPTLGSREVAFATVALERLTGFLALPGLVLVGFALRPSLLGEHQAWVALLVAGATLGLLATIVFLAGHPRAAGRYVGNDNWTRFIGIVHEGVVQLRSDPRRALGVIGAAAAYQASVVATVAVITTMLDLPVPIAAVIAFTPAVSMIQVLPISLNGLGVREGMFVMFLTPLGATHAQAVATGLLWYSCVLLTSLLGAPMLIASRKPGGAAASAEPAEVP